MWGAMSPHLQHSTHLLSWMIYKVPIGGELDAQHDMENYE